MICFSCLLSRLYGCVIMNSFDASYAMSHFLFDRSSTSTWLNTGCCWMVSWRGGLQRRGRSIFLLSFWMTSSFFCSVRTKNWFSAARVKKIALQQLTVQSFRCQRCLHAVSPMVSVIPFSTTLDDENVYLLITSRCFSALTAWHRSEIERDEMHNVLHY